MGHNCGHYSFSWACWHSLDLDMMISWQDKSPYQKDLCLRGWSCCRERILQRPLNADSKRLTPGVFIRETRGCGSQCRCWGVLPGEWGHSSHLAVGPGKIFVEWKPHCYVPKKTRSCARKPCLGSWGVSMCDEGQGRVRGWTGPLIYMLKS